MQVADLSTVSADENISPTNTEQSTSGALLPVKNTFIHFDDVKQGRVRCLRRWRTDPAEPTAQTSREGSDSESTTEPDPLDALADALTSLDFEVGTQTPEHTPRHTQDPWYTSPTVEPRIAAAQILSPAGSLVTHSPVILDPTSSHSMASSVSSSPQSSTFLDAAFNQLSITGSPHLLESGRCVDLTLRLADDVGLGVDFAPCADYSQALLIECILPNGGIAAWNKQCFACPSKRSKAVLRGDSIVAVNGKTEHSEMIQECKTEMLLKLTVTKAVRNNSTHMSTVPMTCSWSSTQVQGRIFQACQWTGKGERLHSCKKPVNLLTNP